MSESGADLSSILPRFASDYVRPHIFSFSCASFFLLATNYLTVSIPEQIGFAIDNFLMVILSHQYGTLSGWVRLSSWFEL